MFTIGFYQKYSSPCKCFVCAHRACRGELSCSGCARETIATHGLWRALPLIKARFVECRRAYTLLSSSEGGD
ncbi:membrane protein insertion efficiency factor YidD, partial [Acinetobacter baumannii]